MELNIGDVSGMLMALTPLAEAEVASMIHVGIKHFTGKPNSSIYRRQLWH